MLDPFFDIHDVCGFWHEAVHARLLGELHGLRIVIGGDGDDGYVAIGGKNGDKRVVGGADDLTDLDAGKDGHVEIHKDEIVGMGCEALEHANTGIKGVGSDLVGSLAKVPSLQYTAHYLKAEGVVVDDEDAKDERV